MKSVFIIGIFFVFIPFTASLNEQQWTSKVKQRLNEIRKQKEMELNQCCKSNEIGSECDKICSYDIYKNPYESLKTLNPGWFLIHHFLPGKCYLSKLDHLIPCSIKAENSVKCCKNMSKVVELLKTFPELNGFMKLIPSDDNVAQEPEFCQPICEGKPFEITMRRFFSCLSTLKAAMACFLYENVDNVVKELSTGLSIETVKKAYDYIQIYGAPDTLEKAKEMAKSLGQETIKALSENSDILAEGLRNNGVTESKIIEIQKQLASIMNSQ